MIPMLRVTVNLNDEEAAMLEQCRHSQVLGTRGRSEFFRFLLRREHLRRTQRTSVVPDAKFATEHRMGRPRRKAVQA